MKQNMAVFLQRCLTYTGNLYSVCLSANTVEEKGETN